MLALPVPHGWRWRFVTLTLAASGDLAADYTRLREGWNVLRARWKRRYGKQVAGVAAVEVGNRGTRKNWDQSVHVGRGQNVHVHLLALLPWVEQSSLADEWQGITGDSRIVDVRLVKDGVRKGLAEVCKYLTDTSEDRAPEELVRIYKAFRGKQTHRVWGALHGTVVHAPRKPIACDDCGGVKWWPVTIVEMMERGARAPP